MSLWRAHRSSRLADVRHGCRLQAALTLTVVVGCAPSPDGTLSTHEFTAFNVDQTYTLTVFEHDAFTDGAPVAYLFDGDDWTEETALIVSELVGEGTLTEPPLVVGIGYGETPNMRHRDYTPPREGIPEGHGEVEFFMDFMLVELLPWVEEGWPVSSDAADRILVGHSFGGIAALWGLLEEDETFGRAVAISPSLAFGQGTLFDREVAYAEEHADLDAALYLAAGSQEAYGMAALTEAFGGGLQARQYPSLRLQTELLKGETHGTVFPVAAEAGLAFVLGGGQ